VGVSYLQGMHGGGVHKGMPKVNLKTYFKKIMPSLSLYCHVRSWDVVLRITYFPNTYKPVLMISITIYITVFVTRGRHFGARESV
jgi:hypothetical protein